MQFIDGSKVHVFAPEDERPHAPGPEESWQESFVIYWYDEAQRIGGGFRLGTEPNHQSGRTQFLMMIVTPDGAFRRVDCLPARPGDVTADGVTSGDGTLAYRFDGETIRWSMNERDVQAELTVAITVPPINAHRKAGVESAEAVLSAHVDSACRVTGTMTVMGRAYALDARGIRDHAWGKRDLSSLRSHRWLLADMGDDLSFVAMTFLSADDTLARFGWVIRGTTVHLATSVTTRAMTGDDGATAYGGTLEMLLDSGETFRATFEPLYPPFALGFTFLHPAYYSDAYCRVTVGDRLGFGIFESSHNARGGTITPPVSDGAIGHDGWHADIRPLIADAG